MSFPGPSKTITVEPIRLPAEDAPEPPAVPDPAPQPEPDKAPAG